MSPWPRVPVLDAVADATGGNPKIPTTDYQMHGNYPIIDQGQSGIAGFTDDDALLCKSEGPLILFGDHTCAVKYVNQPFALGADGVKVLKPRSGWDPKYVYWALTAIELPSVGYSRHFKFLKAQHLACPPLAEQERIATILERAETVRVKIRRRLDLAHSLNGALLAHVTADGAHWPEVRLDTLIAPGDRINYGVVQPGSDVEAGVPLIRVSDLHDGRVVRAHLKRIASAIERPYSRSRIRGNEILISCVGTTGIVALVDAADVGSNVARAITRVPIDDPVLRRYVAEHLRADRAQKYFRAELRTVSQPTLNVKQITQTLIPLPPREVVVEFVERVALVDETVQACRHQAAEADALVTSLRDRAFKGEL